MRLTVQLQLPEQKQASYSALPISSDISNDYETIFVYNILKLTTFDPLSHLTSYILHRVEVMQYSTFFFKIKTSRRICYGRCRKGAFLKVRYLLQK